MPNIQPIELKTEELLTYLCGYHGNLVIIVTRYVADAIVPKKHHAKYEVNTTSDKGVIKLES